ncbi:MAG: hypothetical protein IJ088_10690 [Clostridia bacterium]|nr:hypothetical protein [Clostridia bacterium]
MKRFVYPIGLVLAAWVTGFLLLVLVYLIPQDRMQSSVEQSLPTLEAFGGGGELLLGIPQSTLEYFTDVTMVSTAFAERGSLMDRVLLAQMCGEIGDAGSIRNYVYSDQRDTLRMDTYARYWHGYQIFLRPLLTVINVNQIRMLGMMCMCALAMFIIVRLVQQQRIALLIPQFALFVMPAPFVLLINMQCYGVTFTTLLMILLLLSGRFSGTRAILLFELGGILTSFFDLLSVPGITLGVPLVFYFSVRQDAGHSLRRACMEVLQILLAWEFGYGGMWAGKWIFATCLTGENVIEDALQTVKLRSGSAWGERQLSYFDTVQKNWACFNTVVYKLLFIALAVVLCVFLLRGWRFRLKQEMLLGVVLASLFPFLWYRMTINHSYLHYYFACKELVIFLYGIVTAAFASLSKRSALSLQEREHAELMTPVEGT